MQFSGVIFFFILKILMVLWVLFVNADLLFLFSIGFRSGGWLEHSSSFDFLSQAFVSFLVFWLIVSLKCTLGSSSSSGNVATGPNLLIFTYTEELLKTTVRRPFGGRN